MTNNVYLLFMCLNIVLCATVIHKNNGKKLCKEISELVLEEILGPSFNSRYMSIGVPVAETNSNSNKRKVGYEQDFYVDSRHEEDVDENPAWNVVNHVEVDRNTFGLSRYKRDEDYLRQWQCKSRIKWMDLGPDYFPRYLRSVECLAENCWFNIYKCRPRSFAVKILKKRRGRCVTMDPAARIGTSGLPKELRELWVWEERAVSFCCDCRV